MQPLIDHDSAMAAQFEKEMRQYLDTLNVPAKKRAEQGLDPNPVSRKERGSSSPT